MVNQSLYPGVSGAELKEMEAKIKELQEKLRLEEDTCRSEEARQFNNIL